MEERNIKLSLEKAREFYSKGGEFKDLALSAFTEEEILIPALPKTWEGFCNNFPIKGGIEHYIKDDSSIARCALRCERYTESDSNLLPSREAAEQHLALMQLHQLRDCYRQGWIPDFRIDGYKFCIIRTDKIDVVCYSNCHNSFLSFQSRELAEEFLNNFRDLIVQAGDLI